MEFLLDELLNANSAVLNSLLMALNERTNALIATEVGADEGAEFPGPRALYNL